MCGIAGVINLSRDPAGAGRDAANARRMTEALRHRGPDGLGVVDAWPCVLGNTRLSILDPGPAAALPMANEDGGVVIAYNGEVTNFRELEEEFGLRRKHRFVSSSDTEVLLHLYEELGIGLLSRLAGQFAFALLDRRAGKVHIARDFYGIRPVFWMRRDGRLYFASEIKAFLGVDGFSGELDRGALHDYFSLAYIPGEATPWRDVRELQGGRRLEIDLKSGKVSETEYYSPDYPDAAPVTEEAAASRLRGLMRDAVRRNLISDAPAGMTLSGGFDTSSMLALARDLGLSKGLHTFSIKINESSFDESRYQRLMSGFAGTVHHEVTVDPEDVLEELKSHMAYMDEPSGDGAAIPTFLLAREARKHVKSLLSGEGGDEVFNAYETHGAYAARAAYRRFVPAAARRLVRAAARRLPVSLEKLSLDFRLKRFTEGAELSVPAAHLYWRHVLTEAEKKELLPGLGGHPPTEELFEEFFRRSPFSEEWKTLSLLDIKYFFIADLMVKNDRMMMAHSVEARFPYMDRPLVEFAASLPFDMKVRRFGFERRRIQKRAMEGLLPRAILERSNMGLEMPHAIWFLGKFRKLGDKYFSGAAAARTGVLDPAGVDRLWKEHLARKRDNGRALWCVLMFQVWQELFVLDGDYKKYLRA